MTSDARSTARTYLDAWQKHDFAALRELMADDVTFEGPMGSVSGADDCIDGLRHLAETIERIVVEKIFVDGDDVLTWYAMHPTDGDPVPTVNWSHLEDGRITRIRALFATK